MLIGRNMQVHAIKTKDLPNEGLPDIHLGNWLNDATIAPFVQDLGVCPNTHELAKKLELVKDYSDRWKTAGVFKTPDGKWYVSVTYVTLVDAASILFTLEYFGKDI